MFAAVAGAWALLLGIGLLMLGNGLQGSLLGLRAQMEGFSTIITGVVMSGYYAGFLAGSSFAPMVVRRVGHIRVFAALATVASAAILLHTILLDPISWTGLRLVTGFCYAGLYVVAESWLNDRADNRTRGQLLSVYMIVSLGGMAAGQFFLNLADPGGFTLFILISVLISCAVVPIALTTGPVPAFGEPTRVDLRDLVRVSPLGVFGTMGSGITQGAVLGIGAVYGRQMGLTVPEIAGFMAALILGGVVLQWPIGHLSDRFDRRRVIILVTLLAAVVALAATLVPPAAGALPAWWPSVRPDWALFAFAALFGGLCFPLYSLCIAHTNDFLEPRQMVAASSALVMVMGVGAVLGPLAASLTMSVLGPAGMFWFVGAVNGAIGVFAVYRMGRRPSIPLEDQGAYVALPVRGSPVAAAVGSQVSHQKSQEGLQE
ncbi:MAG: MFS transporter [Alphaproteobacteria bacterium]|nr:MFS transporter [Alphaproteobacteria bacterium]